MATTRLSVPPDTDIISIARLMIREDVPSVDIVESNGRLAGEVTYRDVLRVLVNMAELQEGEAPSKTLAEIAYNSPVAVLLRELSSSGI